MTSKKLRSIAVSRADGQVGISLTYDTGPKEHILLPIPVVMQLIDRLIEATKQSSAPGDGIAVSEHVSMKIFDPKEH
jgi:hypothetical protein